MLWGVTSSLALSDVRALLQLVAELRSLGSSPAAWRAHLATEIARLCDARVAVSTELRIVKPTSGDERDSIEAGTCHAAVQSLVLKTTGLTDRDQSRFLQDVFWQDHAADRTLDRLMPLYGSTFVRGREDLAEDRSWYHSSLANERFREHDCDDFIMAMCAVPSADAICSLELFRPWGAARFEERERLLVQLVHEELQRDFQAQVTQASRLSPRQRQVLSLLQTGQSEKQIAADLDVSPHTVHDYVKALYRIHGVSSRSELLAQVSRVARPQVLLAAPLTRS
jgi:DNA-binding CsgD family transcriptional regulator